MQKELKIKSFDGAFDAYVATPVTTPAPVIVVLQEVFGVNQGIRQIADGLAKQGFIVICPDLFWRFEPGLQLSDHKESDQKKGLDYLSRYDVDAGVKDIAATIAIARKFPGSTGRVGVMGFCFGGLMTFLTAAREDIDAGVEYYGGQTEKFVAEGKKIKKPLLIHLAGEDEFMDNAAKAIIVKELADNSYIKIHMYPHSHHAFARPNGDQYNAKHAEMANSRTLAFFTEHLINKKSENILLT